MPAAQRRMIYTPRPLQAELHSAFKRFNVLVCHRRFGKTTLAINQIIGSGLKAKKRFGGTRPFFGYIAPLRNQVKNIAWDPLKYYTAPFIETQSAVNEAELRVDLFNGTRIQLFGADNPDAARGIGLDGVFFDEFGDMDPTMWTRVIGPALSDRQGYAGFIGTPKGPNHFQAIYDEAVKNENGLWYSRLLKASETGIIPEEELARWRSQMSEDEYAQEFECSFASAVPGAYYARVFEAAESEGRVGVVPHEPELSVHTAWDLGIGDATAIWCAQIVGREIRVIDYIESSGVGLDWYVTELRRRSYTYGTHILPHDVEVKELGTGRSRLETLRSLGVGQTITIAAQSVDDGINAVRMVLPRCWFDARKCDLGLRALRAYRSEWDGKRQTLRPRPLHDWASHGADAFRYLALGLPRIGDRRSSTKSTRLLAEAMPNLGSF